VIHDDFMECCDNSGICLENTTTFLQNTRYNAELKGARKDVKILLNGLMISSFEECDMW